MSREEDSLFYMPQCRDNLLDRITNAYFKRSRPEDSLQAEQAPPRRRPSVSNPGPRLYKNALRVNEKKKSLLNESLLKASQEALLECSFHPNLNSSAEAYDKEKRARNRVGTFNLLFSKAGKPNPHVESLRKLKERLEISHLRDRPRINELSQKIVQAKRGLNQASADKENLRQSNPQLERSKDSTTTGKKDPFQGRSSEHSCSFAPIINCKSASVVKLLGKDFYQRVDHFVEKKAENLKKQQQQREEELRVDPATNQPLFRPLVNRQIPPGVRPLKPSPSPGPARKTSGLKASDPALLLSPSQLSGSKDQQRRLGPGDPKHRIQMAGKVLRPPLGNKRSRALVSQREESLARGLFSILDGDRDGVISPERIALEGLSTELLKLLSPLLFELEELRQTLTLPEFTEALRNLLKTLSPQDRSLLCQGPRRPWADPNLTFKPRINPQSQALSKSVRPYGQSSLFDYYIQEKRSFNEAMAKKRAEREAGELSLCTFQPRLLGQGANRQQQTLLSKSLCSEASNPVLGLDDYS